MFNVLMINKIIHLYIKQINKPKSTVIDKSKRSLVRVLEKLKTPKYKSC